MEPDGWLLRDAPDLRGRARSNAALPLGPDADWAIPLAWAEERRAATRADPGRAARAAA